jgi:hypothetical protein
VQAATRWGRRGCELQRVGDGEDAGCHRPTSMVDLIIADLCGAEEAPHREQGWHTEASCTRPPPTIAAPCGGGRLPDPLLAEAAARRGRGREKRRRQDEGEGAGCVGLGRGGHLGFEE